MKQTGWKCLKLAVLAGGVVSLLGAGMAMVVLYFSNPPSLYNQAPDSQAFYSSDDKLLRLTLSQDEQYRLWVPLAEISLAFQEATQLYEDQHFYAHRGVNVFSVLRAAYSTYLTDERRMGASTLTMQLARMRFGMDSRTVSGKLWQIWQALVLERHYSKQRLLEAYLNRAPYGHNIQGIGAASLIYFHKKPSELSTAEALLLAVVPQNPNKRVLSKATGYNNASQARQRLLRSWIDEKALSDADTRNLLLPLHVHKPSELPYHAPHFIDQIIALAKHQGASAGTSTSTGNHSQLNDRNRRTTGNNNKLSQNENNHRTHTTTLSLDLQQAIERMTTAYIRNAQSTGLTNAAVMVIDHTTMAITAELGSVNYFDTNISGQVNGTRALRSPGSTLKPFIYALGLEQGLIHPSSLLADTPKRFNAYTPENYDKQFTGPLSARDALVRSRNIPAVSLLRDVSNPSFHSWLAQTNPRRLAKPEHYGLALALGGNEVSMLELLQWYATLANHGTYAKARSLQNDATSQRIDKSARILSPEASFLTLDMLSSNPEPAQRLDRAGLSIPHDRQSIIPWKTGTSFAFRDAWSIGIVGNHVVGVWVGNFDGSANPTFIGRKAAGPLFFQIAKHIEHTHTSKRPAWMNTKALNLKKIAVCKTSGDLDIEHCPDVAQDWFIPGVSPIKSNRVFREIPIDDKTGLRACNALEPDSHLVVYEFWPSDIEAVFARAGIDKKKPPPFLPQCEQFEHNANADDAPDITSPDPSLVYALRSNRLKQEKIPLLATVASDANKLYWFVDNQFIGEANPNIPMLWTPKQGLHRVTVIDDSGRSSQTSVRATLVN